MQASDPQRRRKRSHGFSMLESLIALAICSAVMTAYFQSLSTSLQLDRRSRAQAQAAIVASRLMDQVGAEIAVEPMTLEGAIEGGGSYTITIVPGAGALTGETGTNISIGDKIATVEIVVAAPDLPQSYRLVSLRLVNGTLR